MPIPTFLAACALAAGCTAPWQALPLLAWSDSDPSLQAARHAACTAEGVCSAPAARRTASATTAPSAPAVFTPDLPPSTVAGVDGAHPADGVASAGWSATPLGALLLAVLGAALFVGWRTRSGTRDR